MPEMLFKGKRMDNGEWVEGFYVGISFDWSPQNFADTEKGSWIVSADDALQYSVDPATVGMALCGATVNGKRLFVGDIFTTIEDDKWSCSRVFEVCYGRCGGAANTKRFGYEGFYVKGANEETVREIDLSLRTDILYWLENYSCKIIGNIHDKEAET